jgi:hypothetical protein
MAASTPRRGRSQRFDIATDAPVSVGRWDRFATLGEKVKNDQQSDFTPENLSAMVGNWYARASRLPMCLDHQSALDGLVRAPAAAFYDALAVVADGRVVEFMALGGSLATSPDVEQLRAQVAKFATAGDLASPDGLWGYRCEVTPLGQHPTEGLRNYQGISPLFVMDGTDEQQRSIGPVLFDVAAVNVPFQAGCELTLGRLSPGAARAAFGGNTMDSELMKKLGLFDGAPVADKMAAYQTYAFGDASPEEIKAMADDLEKAEEPAAKSMASKPLFSTLRVRRKANGWRATRRWRSMPRGCRSRCRCLRRTPGAAT